MIYNKIFTILTQGKAKLRRCEPNYYKPTYLNESAATILAAMSGGLLSPALDYRIDQLIQIALDSRYRELLGDMDPSNGYHHKLSYRTKPEVVILDTGVDDADFTEIILNEGYYGDGGSHNFRITCDTSGSGTITIDDVSTNFNIQPVTEDTPVWLSLGKYRVRFMYKQSGVVYNVLYKEIFSQDSDKLLADIKKAAAGIIKQPNGSTASDIISSCVHYVCFEYMKNYDKVNNG